MSSKVQTTSRILMLVVVSGLLLFVFFGMLHLPPLTPLQPPKADTVDFNFLNEVVKNEYLLKEIDRGKLGLPAFFKKKKKDAKYLLAEQQVLSVIRGTNDTLRQQVRKMFAIDGLLYYYRENLLKGKQTELDTLDKIYTQMGHSGRDWNQKYDFLYNRCKPKDSGVGFATLLERCLPIIDELIQKERETANSPLNRPTPTTSRRQISGKVEGFDDSKDTPLPENNRSKSGGSSPVDGSE